MTETTHVASLEEARKYIDSINFSNVITRIITTQHWKQEDVLKIETLYKNFLFLHKKYPDKLFPPSEEIDEFWHNHILNTEQYIKDCNHIFGKYLHHDPNVVMDGRRASSDDMQNEFKITQALYHQEFGSYIYEVRMNVIKQFLRFVKLLLISMKQTQKS